MGAKGAGGCALRGDGRRVLLDTNHDPGEPGPGEALVRPTRIALAAADVAAATGPAPFVGVLGSEFVGLVERVGPDHDARADARRWLGKRVVGAALIPCGSCDRCRSGLSQHCAARRVMGRAGRDGVASHRFLIPVRNLAEAPRAMPDDTAVFAQAVARAVHAAHIVRLEGRMYITVLGDGCLALLCAQLAARLNASVRLLGRRHARLELCARWGVRHRHVDEAGRRNDQDVVIDCTGSPDFLALATGFVKPRGVIVLAARPAQAANADGLDTAAVVENELSVLGCRGGVVAEGLSALASGRIDTAALAPRRFRLADALAAAQAAADPGPDNACVRALIEP